MKEFNNNENIYITKPILPDKNELNEYIDSIWESKYLTNMGKYHNSLECRLKEILKVPNTKLFNNGTIALLTAIKALNLPPNSEVITTPFTFAATPHCISWNGLKPVFCDIEPKTMTIDVQKIESLITSKTSAILAVHVYGFPCNIKKIKEISVKYNLKVIYDAAHAFSTEIDGKGIGEFGDISMFSFHATKLYNTLEGGCLTFNDNNLMNKIQNLRNFGIKSEEIVEDIGINGKMNELQAAIGLLNLNLFKDEQKKRMKLKNIYDKAFSHSENINLPKMPLNTTHSLQYYPIIIENEHKLNRDEIYLKLKEHNIHTRKYFSPLCSDYECYKDLDSSKKKNLPTANEIKNKILCLPFYGDIENYAIEKICEVIK